MSLRSWPVRLAETAATVVMVTAVVKAVVEVVVVVVRAVVGCTSLEVDPSSRTSDSTLAFRGRSTNSR